MESSDNKKVEKLLLELAVEQSCQKKKTLSHLKQKHDHIG